MNKKLISKLFVGILLFVFGAIGCGSSDVQKSNLSGDGSQTGSSSMGGPEVGNLPPPSSSGQTSQGGSPMELRKPGADFFENKADWDSLTPEAQEILKQHQAELINRWNASQNGQSTEQPKITKNLNPTNFYGLLTGTLCTDGSQFICVSAPQDGEGTSLEKYTVQGAIELCQVQASLLPRAGWVTVVPPGKTYNITLTRARNCPMADSKDVYSFTQDIDTPGPGPVDYLVSVNSVKAGGTPDSQTRTLTRQGPPKIKLNKLSPPDNIKNLYPSNPAERTADLCTNPNCQGLLSKPVSMPAVKATIELVSKGTDVSIKIMNYDDDGSGKLDPNKLRYISAGDQFKVSGTTTKDAVLRLFPGKNHFKIVASNPLGTDELPEIIIDNIEPTVGVKVISPTDKVVEQYVKSGTNYILQGVKVQFCLVNLPALQGRSDSSGKDACIKGWTGDKPNLRFNGADVTDKVVFDPGSGIFSFEAVKGQTCTTNPQTGEVSCPPADLSATFAMLGSNIFTITAALPKTWDDSSPPLSTVVTNSFGYGMSNKPVLDNDVLKQGLMQNALSLEVNKKIVNEDVKKILLNYLNNPNFKTTLVNFLKTDKPLPPISCPEVGGTLKRNSSLNILNDASHPFTLGSFEIPLIQPETYTDAYGTHTRLNVTVKLNGLHADTDYYQDLTVPGLPIPLRFDISELTLAFSVTFNNTTSGLRMDITPQGGNPVVNITPADSFATVDLSRDGTATGYKKQEPLIRAQVKDSFGSTVLCVAEGNFNDGSTWEDDLKKLTKYDSNNPFRIPDAGPTEKILGKNIKFDIAFNPLRAAAISFDREGLQLLHLPLRITAGKDIINSLPSTLVTSIGSLSHLKSLPDLDVAYSAWQPLVNCDPAVSPICRKYKFPLPAGHSYQDYDLGVQASEDLINQALFALNLTGLLNLDIDPDFFIHNKMGFINLATPTVRDFFDPSIQIDANKNGLNDDANLPVRLSIRTDPALAPHIHFLSRPELVSLVGSVNKATTGGVQLNPALKYFRISLANVEVGIYPLVPKQYATYCATIDDKKADQDPFSATRGEVPQLDLKAAMKRGAAQPVSFFFPCPKDKDGNPQNPDSTKYNVQEVPVATEPFNSATPPLVRFKVNLAFYGVIQGSYDEVMASDTYFTDKDTGVTWPKNLKTPPTKVVPTVFLRAKILSTDFGDESADPAQVAPFEAFTRKVEVIENNTSENRPEKLELKLKTILRNALSQEGQNFNEIRIPLTSLAAIPSVKPAAGSLLDNLGIDYFKLLLGDETKPESLLMPQAMVDDNLFPEALNILSPIYICTKEEVEKKNPLCPLPDTWVPSP